MISLIVLNFFKSAKDAGLLKDTVCKLLLFIIFLNSLFAAEKSLSASSNGIVAEDRLQHSKLHMSSGYAPLLGLILADAMPGIFFALPTNTCTLSQSDV